jgi:excisionase family DNA binding protein
MTQPKSETMRILERLSHVDKFLGVQSVADLFGDSYTTIYRRARSGKMPHLRFGATIKFDPAELAAWIKDHRV